MSKKILVVDDEVEICTILRRFFQQQGFEVVTSTDGDNALTLATKERPHLILLDMKMPGISGVEVLRILRENHHPAKVVILSAVKDESVIKETLRMGADGYLTKPFRLEQVAQLMNSLLGLKASPSQGLL